MALAVEAGTGESDSESYVSATDATTYFTAHGAPAVWTAAVSAGTAESALRYAAVWLDRRYQWIGDRYTVTQALAWPRDCDYDNDGKSLTVPSVPQSIKDAQCEAALVHLSNTLAEVRDRGGAIESASVGPLSVTYSSSAPGGRSFPYLDALLAPLVESGPGSLRAVLG